MRNTLKMGISLIIMGLVVFSVAFVMSDFDINKINSVDEYVEKSFVTSKDVRNIEIHDSNKTINVVKSTDESIHIKYYENENETYDISDENNLTIRNENHIKWYDNLININIYNNELTLCIPKNYEGTLNIKNSNGSVKVEDILFNEIDIKTSNGKVKLDDISVNKRVNIETSNASVSLETFSSENLYIRTSSGKVLLNDCIIKNNLEVDNSNGKVELDNIKLGDITKIQTSNGSIYGSIIGEINDFSIDSKTSNGSNNLSNRVSGDKILKLKTSNAGINIDFK